MSWKDFFALPDLMRPVRNDQMDLVVSFDGLEVARDFHLQGHSVMNLALNKRGLLMSLGDGDVFMEEEMKFHEELVPGVPVAQMMVSDPKFLRFAVECRAQYRIDFWVALVHEPSDRTAKEGTPRPEDVE